jgi:NAD(P)-dependent dehydrogenase (short-subunit alcohol dehydrogenase family)
VRVVYATSGIMEMLGPPGGVSLAEQAPGCHNTDMNHNYSASKAGNWFMASELDKRVRKEGIVSTAVNPGMLKTKGWNNTPWIARALMSPISHEPKMGAYTEIWAGLSPDVTSEDGGRYAIPWGRWHPGPKKELLDSLQNKEDGSDGIAAEFWNWCDGQTKKYNPVDSYGIDVLLNLESS